jgi:hypothetical protein
MRELDDAADYKRAKKAYPKTNAAIDHIREVAERRLAQLLLARFLLLDIFVQEAQKIPGGLQEKVHRRLWVLLQAQPNGIFGADYKGDIFTELAQLLRYAPTSILKDRIATQYQKLSFLLTKVCNTFTGKDDRPPFFCVLDEAQVIATLRRGEFVSEDGSTACSLFREAWLLYTTVLVPEQMRLVLSGTGIELQDLKDTLVSSVLKREPYDIKSNIGAFETRESQAEYIKRYVPASWADPNWAEFLDRAWGWLRGR